MMLKKQLSNAIDYVIESDYDIFNRQIKISEKVINAKNICIFGVGRFFEEGYEYVEKLINVDFVTDNDSSKWGKKYNNLVCIPPNELSKIDDLIVIILIGEYKDVQQQLDELNIENYFIGDLLLNVYDEKYDKTWFEKRREEIINAVDLFDDDVSKRLYVEVICNRISPHLANMSFNDIKVDGEYFNSDIFKVEGNEYYVDGGAYTGDTIEKFLEVSKNGYGAIYAFELNGEVYNKLQNNVQRFNISNIECYNLGLENYNDNEDKDGDKMVRLDDILNGKKVSFIKLDIEGSELNALKGGYKIIKEQNPKLVICLYHKLSDLWEIPLFVKSINNEYKISLRHHSPTVWDTVMYAY